MDLRREYIKNSYAQYWLTARGTIYHDNYYDRKILDLIIEGSTDKGDKVLEVGVGTGEPFAKALSEAGFSVSGVDIAPILIQECKKNVPAMNAVIGDAEKLPWEEEFFDSTYCYHSSWMFPDLEKALDEMFRVTKSGGKIYFDIQNLEHIRIKKNLFILALRSSPVMRPIRWLYLTIKNGKLLPLHKVKLPLSQTPKKAKKQYQSLVKRAKLVKVWGSTNFEDFVEIDIKNSQKYMRIFFEITKP